MIGFLNEIYRPLNIKFLINHIQNEFDECGLTSSGDAKKDASAYLNCVSEYRQEMFCDEPKGKEPRTRRDEPKGKEPRTL